MSKQRAQGTRYESAVVKMLAAAGHTARRLAEGGSLDEGDVEATIHGIPVIVECKARQVLATQETLARTRRKAGPVRLPLVFWRRLVPVTGKRVRQPVAGERDLVILAPADLFRLLDAAYAAGQTSTPAPGPVDQAA